MKKIYPALLCMLMHYAAINAQTNYTYTQIIDSALFPVSKTQITTGVLYDRVFPIAGLHAFKSTDTSFFWHFYQAYSELFNATYNKTGLTPVKQIDSIAQSSYAANSVIPIGVLYYDFNMLDTNAVANNLFYRGADSLLHDVTGRTGNPYLLKNITVVAALAKDTLDYGNGSFKFKFDSQLFLKNKAVTITSLYADFGSGNQNITSGNVLSVTYANGGVKTIKFTVTYSNAQTATAYASIFVTSNIATRYGAPVDPDETKPITDTQYGYQGYGESSKKYNSGTYGIYYHRNTPGGPIETLIKKPIIIVDGFDPTDDRKERDIYGIYLQYSANAGDNFGAQMRNLGYDVIILNFPTLTGTGDPRYQGGDFIQRNAFLLVTLIEKINQELATNGSTEKIVVIGPSMGGLVSRYALKWMENNGKNHNTRLWISFDAPHKGANIPIGDQSFIDFFGGISKTAEEARDKKLSSNAAKQMLLHHYLAGTNLPSGAPNFRNSWQTELDNLGYPQNLRKIALINGAINGTTQGTACQNVFKMKVDLFVRTLFMRIGIIRMSESKVSFAGSYGSNCEVFDGWLYTWLNANKKNAAAPASSKSYDIIPGGYYNAQEEITEKDGWSTIFTPSWTSKFKLWTDFTSYNLYHCFIPTFSALGMDITNKDLSENLYNRDLTCTGETPFQAYYAPMVNQEHITLTTENVAWIKEEIAGNKQMSSVNYAALYPFVQTSGTNPACTNAAFQINNLPSGSTIAWQSSDPSIATVPATGNPVTLTRQGAQSGAITLTATITRPCSGSNIVMTKVITVGIPSISSNSITAQRQGSDCLYDAVVTLSVPGTTVDFSYNNATWFAGLQYGNTFRTGDGTFLGPKYVMIYARTHNTCGTSPVVSKNLYIPARPAGCLMLQPPVVSRIAGEQLSEAGITSQENISIYPNPAGNKLTVVVPSTPGNTVICIYDTGGKLVHTGRLNNATNDLNISSYRSGLYLVRIMKDGTIIKSVKIIKQ